MRKHRFTRPQKDWYDGKRLTVISRHKGASVAQEERYKKSTAKLQTPPPGGSSNENVVPDPLKPPAEDGAIEDIVFSEAELDSLMSGASSSSSIEEVDELTGPEKQPVLPSLDGIADEWQLALGGAEPVLPPLPAVDELPPPPRAPAPEVAPRAASTSALREAAVAPTTELHADAPPAEIPPAPRASSAEERPARRISAAETPRRRAPAAKSVAKTADHVAKEELGASEPSKPVVAANVVAAGADLEGALADKNAFRDHAQRLARARDWEALAAVTSAALDHAKWALEPEARAALLGDLACLNRDRLGDAESAERRFRELLQIEPGNADAVGFLGTRLRGRQDWNELYKLLTTTVESTWAPQHRLAWTREAAAIATQELGSFDKAIEAWERLLELGDAPDETTSALSEIFRRAGRWERLGDFLSRQAGALAGAERAVALREIAEAYLSGARDHKRAMQVLDQLLAERPDDPVALLSYARVHALRKDWAALAELGTRAFPGMELTALTDLRRLAADALWRAEEHDRAVEVYDQILALAPKNDGALRAKEEYLVSKGRIDALVDFLSRRAELADSPEERARLLERAAELAEKDLENLRLAIELHERRAGIEAGREHSLHVLVVLYEQLGDHEGLRRALEGQLALTRNPHQRIELLRRLGDHCAHRLGDDARAESCWREILDAVPDDREVRDQLTDLYRRRKDFEAVDRTLAAQAWRPLDDGSLVVVWRTAALNLQQNLSDPERTVRSWRRVLDLVPDDPMALGALVPLHRALGRARPLVDVLEAQLRITDDLEQRVELTAEIASQWDAEGDRAAALAANERILRLSPAHARALDAIVRLRGTQEAGATRGTLDVAIASVADAERRAALLRQSLELVEAQDPLGRFFALRRLLPVAGERVLAEVAQAAEQANAWQELATVYAELAASAAAPSRRANHYLQLAEIFEKQLKDPARAFLTLQMSRQALVASLDELEPLIRLAEATGRHEDLLALYDVATASAAPLEVRRAALRRRIVICEEKLQDRARAFHEATRLVRLDPRDAQALADARRLAAAAGLWRQLDALFAELWDRATTVPERVEIARARHALASGELGDPLGALDHLLVLHRIEPAEPQLVEQILAAAETLRAWDRVLPVLEAEARAGRANADQLLRFARLHEQKRGDRQRAFELYAEAFLRDPSAIEVDEKLTELAGASGQQALLATCLRSAAARTTDPMRALDLYRRAAALYEGALDRADLALDLHQRILQLQSSALPSVEVVIDHQRKLGLFSELRDRLQHWLELTASDGEARQPVRIERLLEVARVSQDKLSDPETALTSYAQVLEIDPANEEALAGVRALTESATEPAFELRRLRLELVHASGPRRVELQLACARIQQRDLDDLPGALATLRTLVKEAGAASAGYEPLAQLLTKTEAWGELVELMCARAAALTAVEARIETLEGAIAICDLNAGMVPPARKEELYRQLLGLRPSDTGVRRRVLQLYRGAGRYAELAELLERTLVRLTEGGGHPQEQRFIQDELVVLFDRALDRPAAADALLTALLERNADDGEAMLALAAIRLRRGDVAGHVALRERHARLLPPRLGALVLCHLAEVTDEMGGDSDAVVGYYRAAHALDPANASAKEGLRALGRRAKNWRATAALLPDPDERKLSAAERAARLRTRGEAAKTDPAAAADWYERALAVDPDDFQAWDALCSLRTDDDALAARRAALRAFERSLVPDPTSLATHALRYQELAQVLAQAGETEEAARLLARAYELAPTLPAAALAVAARTTQEGAVAEAHRLYHAVLTGSTRLTNDERLEATFRRGLLAAKLGRLDQAIDDLREVLRIDRLHSGALQALADVLADRGRTAAAVQHYTQALLPAWKKRARGSLYARLGRLLDEQLHYSDEAGICYHRAIGAGIDDHEVMMRALADYRRHGQREQAAALIEQLLIKTSAPAELANLWAQRGELLTGEDEARAIEAFDMALSYDSHCRAAVDGLVEVLKRRGEWQQLVDLLEGRAEAGSAAERAIALRGLSHIAREHLRDAHLAERYLRSALDLDPRKEDLEEILRLIGDDPARAQDRQDVQAALLALSGPCVPTIIDLGRRAADDGQRRLAWCLLSVLGNAALADAQLKPLVLELRKELERSEATAAISPETHRRVLHRDVPPALLDVLAELDLLLPVGPRSPDEVGASRIARVDRSLTIGKAFAATAERLGLDGALLARADELPATYRVLDDDAPYLVVRSEILQMLGPSEAVGLCATLLEQARPGARILCAIAPAEANRLVTALAVAVGLSQPDGATASIVESIVAAAGPDRLAAWRKQLSGIHFDADTGERVQAGLQETARRVGLVATGDLQVATKVLVRLDPSLAASLPKAGGPSRAADVEAFFAGAPSARTLVGFAASSDFGRLMQTPLV
jgi:tetratricopeptide (TPR) repeat protein